LRDVDFFVKSHDYNELMVLGGAHVYEQVLNDCAHIYLTRVHHVFEEADAFFPNIDERKWKQVWNEDHAADEKHACDYSFQHWVRK
jgi:dihydrofolate reductase